MKNSLTPPAVLATLLLAASLAGLSGIRSHETAGPPAVSPQHVFREISEDSIMSSIAALTRHKNRALESEGSLQASAYIAEQLMHRGWRMRRYIMKMPDRAGNPRSVANVVADYPPEGESGPVLMLCTHYDSRADEPGGHAPGADDNASGTAVLLEVARILPLLRTRAESPKIRLAFFGGEEDSMLGSTWFVDRLMDADEHMMGAINVDMIGYDQEGPKDFVIFTNEASLHLAKELALCATAMTTLRCEITLTIAANSDHAPFWSRGLQAVSVWEGYDHNPWYHTGRDTPDKLSPPFMAAIAGVLLCAIDSLVTEGTGVREAPPSQGSKGGRQ
ncbi:MAG: M20/M25/M40 family metallo-hydrolase [Chitinivibrionia bacterium]|nr:M20/M25/M40 family metallo-hydrolase [Chitinivibrionia bacterium]